MRNGCSDRLYRAESGELSAEDVFILYEGQLQEELGPYLDDPDMKKCMDESLQALAIAKELYKQHNPDTAIEKMQAHENETVQSIGEALESEDYSALAI